MPMRARAVRQHYRAQLRALAEGALFDHLNVGRDGDFGEQPTVQEGGVPDARQAVRQVDGRQTSAVFERDVTDAGHAGRDGDAGELLAMRHRVVADGRDLSG